MKTIIQTFKLIKEKPLLLMIPFFFDLLAMAIFGYTLADVRMRALNVVDNLNGLLQQGVNQAVEVLNQSNIVETFSQQTELVNLEWALIKLLIFVVVTFWLVWMVFQGGSWRYASIISQKKPKYFKFMWRFVGVNLIWLSCLTLINFFILNHQFNLQVQFHQTSWDVLTVLAVVLNVVVAYFMFISYTLLSNNKLKQIIKKTFNIGVKKFYRVLLTYLVILIGFGLIDGILRLFGLINPTVSFIVGIFLILPYITISRVYLIKSVEKMS